MKETDILNHIILIGGPPRSGTTFAAKSLNLHPNIVAAIDDHVYECWGLYYYRDRVGIVQELRTGPISPEEVKKKLATYLFDHNCLIGAAPSVKTNHFPKVFTNRTACTPAVRSVLDTTLERFEIPLENFSADWHLCLKSPEITFVLPQLAHSFSAAKFVLVYRPVYEIAESMFRLGNLVKRFPVFHQRWLIEKDMSGQFLPPPGIPVEWQELWQCASNFKRCVIYAASYLRAMLAGTQQLASDQYFVYDHAHLRKNPHHIFQSLARFLEVDVNGFETAEHQLNSNLPFIAPQLVEEYANIEAELELKPMMQKIQAILAVNLLS